MVWTKKAPKDEGYYWFLPTRRRLTEFEKSRGFSRPNQEPATVMHRHHEGDWTYVGNEMTFLASELNGRWWTEPIKPPGYE